MTLHRRAVLRKTTGVVLAGGLSGCSLGSVGSGTDGDDSCDADVACFGHSYDETESGLDTLTVSHSGGRDLPAGEVYVAGVAFDWPPARGRGFTYSWDRLSDLEPETGIAGRSVRVHPALVDAVRVLWRREGEMTLLDEIPVSDCDSPVACFEYIHQGADDALDRLTVRHVSGRDIAAGDVALTGIASEYPPDPEEGRTMTWHEVSDLERDEGIAGRSIRIELGLVETVRVLWTHRNERSFLDRFELYETSE